MSRKVYSPGAIAQDAAKATGEEWQQWERMLPKRPKGYRRLALWDGDEIHLMHQSKTDEHDCQEIAWPESWPRRVTEAFLRFCQFHQEHA